MSTVTESATRPPTTLPTTAPPRVGEGPEEDSDIFVAVGSDEWDVAVLVGLKFKRVIISRSLIHKIETAETAVLPNQAAFVYVERVCTVAVSRRVILVHSKAETPISGHVQCKQYGQSSLVQNIAKKSSVEDSNDGVLVISWWP